MAKLRVALACLLLPTAHSMKIHGAADSTAPSLTLSEVDSPKLTLSAVDAHADSVAEMEKIFHRSDADHDHSMDEIAKTMTWPKAMDTLHNTEFSKRISSLIVGGKNLRSDSIQIAKGFGGLDGARKLLNDMIYEAMSKYDAEIAKCTDYYAKQCALMEVCRGQISASNFVAATARGLILDAQYNINKCELSIPETKQELKDHNTQCKNQLKALNKRLKIVMGDIAIMTMILEMSDCDAKHFLQKGSTTMLRCEDECTMKKYVKFNNAALQSKLNELKSPDIQTLMSDSFADAFDDDEDEDTEEATESLLQEGEDQPKKKKKQKDPKKTKFNNPPVPRTKVPTNPCTDPNKGAPSAEDKRAAKCTLKKSPRCYKLQGRFLVIQAGIEDVRDDLMDQISKKEADCDETKKSLEASIEADKTLLSSSQTKLAEAMQKEASAGEKARQVSKENDGYDADLKKQMKICSQNYIDFEGEICALRKIRGDVFKKMKAGHKGFFQDCELNKWSPEACTKKCAGGTQKLTRSVLSHPGPPHEPGAKCLPLAAERRCNLGPCPIDCKLKTWGGWSKCSAKCGGGMSNRVRDVIQAMKYGGKPCDGLTESKQCNVAACSKNCVLATWTKWTSCSKDCDGGSMKRQRFIKEPSEGSGKCAGTWDKKRLEYKACNMKRCKAPPNAAMKCNATLDVVMVMDGTPKSGKKGWAAEVQAANTLIDAFSGAGVTAKPNVAVIHFSGPRTWTGVSKCTGKSKKKVDMEKTCKISIAQHFSEDMKKAKATISGLSFTPGAKLLSLGLMTVKSELALGRKTAPTVVIVFLDGAPLSFRKTMMTSHEIRKKARLVYVPVVKFSPLKDLKTWSSRRWQENLVPVKDIKELAKPETGTHIVANICPQKFPKLKMQVKK